MTIGPMSPMWPALYSMAYVTLAFCVALFAVPHVKLTKSDIHAALTGWNREAEAGEVGQREVDQKLCYEQEVKRTRAQMLVRLNKLLIHVCFSMALVMLWTLVQKPSPTTAIYFCAPVLAYIFHALPDSIATNPGYAQILEGFTLLMHGLWVAGIATEKDFATFCAMEKLSGIGLVLISMVFIDVKLILPLHLFEASLLTWNQWHLAKDLNTVMVFSSLVAHLFVAISILFVDQTMRSMICAKVEASDKSSLMLGFRQVLRGVCDGDLLLDRGSCAIVDDASCLERLLKLNKKLSKTNFLDLFLDSESRQRFSQFVSTQDADAAGSTMPRGMRVLLQGASGPVSMDIFHTRLQADGDLSDYCLLALKEDPEQVAPPDALHSSPPLPGPAASPGPTASTASEVVEAYDELREIALLVSNETGLFDIKEVHLAFKRQNSAPTIECGMPTLRRFIRPTDWDRIEQMFEIMVNLPPADLQQRCTFRHPMLFRLPGESRNYLCSRETSVYLAGEVVPERPVHFWMNLSSFDASQIRRPREQELEGIREE